MSRLSDLKRIVGELQQQGFDFSSLPTNSEIKTFYEWSTDAEKRELDEASITASGNKSWIGLAAFGFVATDDADATKVKIGTRAKGKATDIGLAKFGLTETLTANHIERNGFIPAKCIAALKTSPGTRVRSAITSRYYRPRTNGTWTIPFGKVSTKTEFQVQSDLVEDSALANYALTFTPEAIKRK